MLAAPISTVFILRPTVAHHPHRHRHPHPHPHPHRVTFEAEPDLALPLLPSTPSLTSWPRPWIQSPPSSVDSLPASASFCWGCCLYIALVLASSDSQADIPAPNHGLPFNFFPPSYSSSYFFRSVFVHHICSGLTCRLSVNPTWNLLLSPTGCNHLFPGYTYRT